MASRRPAKARVLLLWGGTPHKGEESMGIWQTLFPEAKPSAEQLISIHGSAHNALEACLKDGSYRSMLLATLQKLLTLAYAEDKGWTVS